jgi:hypothetical protein
MLQGAESFGEGRQTAALARRQPPAKIARPGVAPGGGVNISLMIDSILVIIEESKYQMRSHKLRAHRGI